MESSRIAFNHLLIQFNENTFHWIIIFIAKNKNCLCHNPTTVRISTELYAIWRCTAGTTESKGSYSTTLVHCVCGFVKLRMISITTLVFIYPLIRFASFISVFIIRLVNGVCESVCVCVGACVCVVVCSCVDFCVCILVCETACLCVCMFVCIWILVWWCCCYCCWTVFSIHSDFHRTVICLNRKWFVCTRHGSRFI